MSIRIFAALALIVLALGATADAFAQQAMPATEKAAPAQPGAVSSGDDAPTWQAQPPAQHATLDPARSSISATGRGTPPALDLVLALSQPVPYRLFLLDAPRRLVIDFRRVDFGDQDPAALSGADLVSAIRWGGFRPGWSRMVIALPAPYAIESATQTRQGAEDGTQLRVALRPVPAKDFAPRPHALSALWDLPEPAETAQVGADAPAPEDTASQNAPAPAMAEATPAHTLRVMLDPGHGGHDSGAVVGDLAEADLILSIALELRAALVAQGVEVAMTRGDDSFVPLETRMSKARAAGADLLISLHADALPIGSAAGATVYVWNPKANDQALRQLAERHGRSDLVSGLDLEGADDHIAGTLMALARADTHPRSVNFAKFLSSNMARGGVELHRNPVKGAAFSVLKSPDIPSVLLELGFLTDPRDRAKLTDPGWRQRMVVAITNAVREWAEDEAARAPLLRR